MDKTILFLVNRQWTSPWVDQWMATCTNFAAWLPILLLALIILVWRGRFRERSFVAAALLALALTDGIITQWTKKWIHRPRPAEALVGVREVSLQKTHPAFLGAFKPVRVSFSPEPSPSSRGRSFPSGHTVNNTLIAIFAVCYFGRIGAIYLLPAAVVAYSRVYCGSHWPSDVLLSIVLALLSTFFLIPLFSVLYRHVCRRWASKFYAAHPDLIPARRPV